MNRRWLIAGVLGALGLCALPKEAVSAPECLPCDLSKIKTEVFTVTMQKGLLSIKEAREIMGVK